MSSDVQSLQKVLQCALQKENLNQIQAETAVSDTAGISGYNGVIERF